MLDGERQLQQLQTLGRMMIAGRRRCRCRYIGVGPSYMRASDSGTCKWGSNVTRVRNDARGPYQRPQPRLVTRNSTFHLPPDSAPLMGKRSGASSRDQVYPGNCFDAPFRRLRCSRCGDRAASSHRMECCSVSRRAGFCAPPVLEYIYVTKEEAVGITRDQ